MYEISLEKSRHQRCGVSQSQSGWRHPTHGRHRCCKTSKRFVSDSNLDFSLGGRIKRTFLRTNLVQRRMRFLFPRRIVQFDTLKVSQCIMSNTGAWYIQPVEVMCCKVAGIWARQCSAFKPKHMTQNTFPNAKWQPEWKCIRLYYRSYERYGRSQCIVSAFKAAKAKELVRIPTMRTRLTSTECPR